MTFGDRLRRALSPEELWWWSTRAHARGHRRVATVLKGVNYVAYRAILPPECTIERDLVLYHHGLGVVVHPNTRIGRGVVIAHGVTIAAGSVEIDPRTAVVLEDGVRLGTGAVLVAKWGHGLRIGARTSVGANATITRDMPPDSRVLGPPARPYTGDAGAAEPASPSDDG